jgi:proton-dependent oligopeptide transporter, POT family
MTTAGTPAGKQTFAQTKNFLGHPIGLSFLFTTEMWERFSYYGMRAILVLYLTHYLFDPTHVGHVWGYETFRNICEALFGTLSSTPTQAPGEPIVYQQQFSSIIYGLYTGFVYLTPFFGGILADRVWGQRKSVIIGGVIMAIAEFVLTQDALFLPGLLLLIIGNGAFKPNISTQVGNLYQKGDSRIDRAFSIFYVGINVGAFFSPLICGTLGEKMCTVWATDFCRSLGETAGWHFGFFAAGVGMVLGLITYLLALRTMPPDNLARSKAAKAETKKLTGTDWKAVISLIILFIPVTFFWATYEQQGNTISLWADQFTDRRLIPGVVDWQIPVTWFQAFNPFMIFAFTPFIVAFWARQSKKGTEPSTVTKMALGCLMCGLSYLVLAAAAYVIGESGHASWLWLLVFFAIITVGELYLSPLGLSLVSRVSPPQIVSMMMGVWFITNFTGNLLEGYLGSFWSTMDKFHFFLMIAGIVIAAGAVIWLFDRPLKPILDAKPALPPGPAPAP